MYLVGKDIRSKIHNEEYRTVLKRLLQRIELIEQYIISEQNPSFKYALDDLIKEQEE